MCVPTDQRLADVTVGQLASRFANEEQERTIERPQARSNFPNNNRAALLIGSGVI